MRNGPELGADMVFKNLDSKVGNGTDIEVLVTLGCRPFVPDVLVTTEIIVSQRISLEISRH
jgi:hypothetical protein